MRNLSFTALILGGYLLTVVGCASDPNVEGAKLDIQNQNYDRAIENLEIALTNNPENAEAWKYKGVVYQEMAASAVSIDEKSDLVQQMMEAYDRAIELDPGEEGDIETRLQIAWVDFYRDGVAAFEQGGQDTQKYEEAATHFRNSRVVQPDSLNSYINEGYALIAAGSAVDAIEPLEIAIEKGEDNPDTHLYLAELYFMADRPNDAVDLLEETYEKFEVTEEILSDLLNAYIRTDNLDRARDLFGDAVEMNPDNALYRYNYGSLLLQADEFEEAIEHLEVAIELDPENPNAWFNLGAAYQNMAVSINDQREERQDVISARRDELSAEERQAIEAEIDELEVEMRSLFAQAIEPLERARDLMEQQGDDPIEVCQGLFRAYVQTNDMESAEAVAECANIDLD